MTFNLTSIQRHVDGASFDRGRHYFKTGRVTKCERTDTGIAGTVDGRKVKPYQVTITLSHGEISNSHCSCPLWSSCKHVAALGLAAIEQDISQTVQSSQPSHQSSWKTTLTQIVDQSTVGESKFQLQIYLKFFQEWNKQRTQFVWCVQIRPRLVDTATGKSSLTDFQWRDVQYRWKVEQLHLPVQQFAVFQQLFFALQNDSWFSSAWITLTDKTLELFCQIMQQSTAVGVALVVGKKQIPAIAISQTPLQIVINITENTSGGLVVSNQLKNDGVVIPLEQCIFPGNTKTCAFVAEQLVHSQTVNPNNMSFTLYSIRHAQPNAMIWLVQPVTIPQADIADFKDNLLPQLMQCCTIDSATTIVSVPQRQAPHLLVMVEPADDGQIMIQLTAQYGDTKIDLTNLDIKFIQHKDQWIIRDVLTEQQLWKTVRARSQIDGQLLFTDHTALFSLSGILAARFVAEVAPHLQQLPNVIVQLNPQLPAYTYVPAKPKIEFSVNEPTIGSAGTTDWFDLAVNLMIEGEPVPFADIFQALVKEQTHLLLDNGRYISLDHEHLQQLRKLLAETKLLKMNQTGTTMSVSRYQVDVWQELQGLGVIKEQTERWQNTMTGLLNSTIKRVAPPKQLPTKLRSYQTDGYTWLRFLHKYELGGILADDMGLGKTIQTIALMLALYKKIQHPFLVVAPTSVVENWDMELARFAPKLKKVVLRRGDRSHLYQDITKADIIVTSYALAQRDQAQLKKLSFDTIILDEAQYVKNYQAKVYAVIRQLKRQRTFALTGTPMENNLMELWSIFSLVAPGLLPAPDQFRQQYQKPIEYGHNVEILQQLQRRIRPFLLRRTKAVVLKELPAKVEQVLTLELDPKHQKLYDLHLQQERKKVLQLLDEPGGLQKHRFTILQSLTSLRQIALHPQLLKINGARIKGAGRIPAAKLETLVEMLHTIQAGGHRALVFSQFTQFLGLVRAKLDAEKIAYLYLDGSTRNRKQLVEQFQQAGQAPAVFLISLKAGGVGLNLTAADYCFILDPWWNPAVEQQAIDRTHRIGQTKPVLVYKLIAKHTIEEKVLQLQLKKRELFENMLDNKTQFSSLITTQDIKVIFS